MEHEYRHAEGSEICQGCGEPWYFCKGKNAGVITGRGYIRLPSGEIEAIPVGAWDAWCARYDIDPNTSDETLLDDFLHGREPHLEARAGSRSRTRKVIEVAELEWLFRLDTPPV